MPQISDQLAVEAAGAFFEQLERAIMDGPGTDWDAIEAASDSLHELARLYTVPSKGDD